MKSKRMWKKKKQKARQDAVTEKIVIASKFPKLEEKIHYLDTHLLSNNDPFSVVPGTIQVLKWFMEA